MNILDPNTIQECVSIQAYFFLGIAVIALAAIIIGIFVHWVYLFVRLIIRLTSKTKWEGVGWRGVDRPRMYIIESVTVLIFLWILSLICFFR